MLLTRVHPAGFVRGMSWKVHLRSRTGTWRTQCRTESHISPCLSPHLRQPNPIRIYYIKFILYILHHHRIISSNLGGQGTRPKRNPTVSAHRKARRVGAMHLIGRGSALSKSMRSHPLLATQAHPAPSAVKFYIIGPPYTVTPYTPARCIIDAQCHVLGCILHLDARGLLALFSICISMQLDSTAFKDNDSVKCNI